jgi:hypothetical protein
MERTSNRNFVVHQIPLSRVVLRKWKGGGQTQKADPLSNDIKLGEMPLYVSSEYRRTLEILQSSRKKGDESKSLEQSFVEKRMESLINFQRNTG